MESSSGSEGRLANCPESTTEAVAQARSKHPASYAIPLAGPTRPPAPPPAPCLMLSGWSSASAILHSSTGSPAACSAPTHARWEPGEAEQAEARTERRGRKR